MPFWTHAYAKIVHHLSEVQIGCARESAGPGTANALTGLSSFCRSKVSFLPQSYFIS